MAPGSACARRSISSDLILYDVSLLLIISSKVWQSGTEPPNLHHVDCNAGTTAGSACPKDSEVCFELKVQGQGEVRYVYGGDGEKRT